MHEIYNNVVCSMIVKLLTEHHLGFLSLKGSCTSSSESTHVKMPLCWKSHAVAHFSFQNNQKNHAWSCQNVCDTLTFLLDNRDISFIQFGTRLYRQDVGIPIGTNCAHLIADVFLFCYERDFMTSLDKHANIIEAFNTASRYLDVILNINNIMYLDNMVKSRTGILYFIESMRTFQNINKKSFHPLFQEKSHFWHDTGAVATISQPI